MKILPKFTPRRIETGWKSLLSKKRNKEVALIRVDLRERALKIRVMKIGALPIRGFNNKESLKAIQEMKKIWSNKKFKKCSRTRSKWKRRAEIKPFRGPNPTSMKSISPYNSNPKLPMKSRRTN